MIFNANGNIAEGHKTGTAARGEETRAPRKLWPFVVVALALVELFIYRPVAFEVFKLWVLETNVVPSGAMKDTILVGDYIFTDKIAYHFRDPRPGEIVTFTYPYRDATIGEKVNHLFTGEYGTERSGGLRVLIKRVVGGPGDVLQIKDGVLHRNGEPVGEPYPFTDAGGDWGPYVVPTERYFVMGDNRYDSVDSRFIGPVPREYIRARATMIYFSVAPVLCPRHGAPVVPYEGGWRCKASGENMRPGLDFKPAARWRVGRRARWERIGRRLDALP